MTVTCSACAASFPVDPNKIPEGGVKVRCSVCASIFRVERPAPELSPEPTAPQELPVEAPAEDEAPEGRADEDASSDAGRHERVSEEESLPAETVSGEASEDVRGASETEVDSGTGSELASDEEMPQWAVVEEPDPRAEEADEWESPETNTELEGEPRTGSESMAQAYEDPADRGEHSSGAPEPQITPERTGWGDASPEPLDWAESENLDTAEDAGPELPEAPPVQEPETATAAELGVQQQEAPVQGFTFGKRDPMDKARRLARVLVSDMVMYNAERHQLALSRGTLSEDFEEEIDKSWKEFVEQVGPDIAEGEGRRFWKQALNDILAKGAPAF